MYHGLMLRWFEDTDFTAGKPQKDAVREKVYKKEYIEKIQKGIVKPFSKNRVTYELLITSIASIIHSFIPQILVHHAAMNVVKLYFNIKIMEKINDN
jgi:phosphomannomutase